MSGERFAGTALLVALMLLTACGGKSTSSRTEHPAAGAQDSMLAKSSLPGARGVGSAMRLADSAKASRAREAAVWDSTP